MSQFYVWLLSKCCDDIIYNGWDSNRLNECHCCGKVLDLDSGSYDKRIRSAEHFYEKHQVDLYNLCISLDEVKDRYVKENRWDMYIK